jgi:hypothetical protein
LSVLTDHPDGIRRKDIALALNLLATSKNTVEGVRAKLKRLVGRDLATEPQPGLLTINAVIPNEQLSWNGRCRVEMRYGLG